MRELCADFCDGYFRQIVFDEFERRLKRHDDVEQRIFDRLQARGKLAFELPRRLPDSRLRPRVYEVADGFGLTEVEAAMREGAQGKLTRFSGARTEQQERVDNLQEQHGRAMTTQFDHVLTCERMRRLKVSDERVIEHCAARGIEHGLQSHTICFWREMIFAQEFAHKFECVQAAQADDADATAAGRGGKSDDGIRGWHGRSTTDRTTGPGQRGQQQL